MEEAKIKQLMDMGFSREMASDALAKSGNDSERAVAFLFGEATEDNQPQEPMPASYNSTTDTANEMIKYEDTVAIRNPQDIPPLVPGGNFMNYGESNLKEFETPDYGYQYDDFESNDSSIFETGILEQRSNFVRQENTPPVILPTHANIIGNYLVPLVMMFSQLKRFEAILYENTSFDEWNYDQNWFKQKLVIEPPQDSDVNTSIFHAELQRMIAFLSDLSERAFITSDNLVLYFTHDVRSPMTYPSGEDIEECIKRFYITLNESNVKFDGLFKSVVESTTEEAKNDFYSFVIDSESRRANIYESLNSLFWTDDENIGNIRFVEVAPVLTFQLYGDEDSYQVEPFEIQEEFYPEIYSDKYAEMINNLHQQRKNITQERIHLTNDIMSINAFEGKIVRSFLTMSIDHLKSCGKEEESDDLQNLKTNIIDMRTDLTSKLGDLSAKYAKLDYTKYENILHHIDESNLPQPKKYILLGAIVSDTNYFFKSKMLKNNDEGWFFIRPIHSQSQSSIIIDYAVESIDFEGVKAYISDHTKDAAKQVVLLYGRQDLYDEDIEIEYPAPIRKFFEQDNSALRQLLQDVEAHSSDSDDDDDDGDDGDVVEQNQPLDVGAGTSAAEQESPLVDT
jgi:hypothetical protein